MAPSTTGSVTCLVGTWTLDVEVFRVDGNPFANGGEGAKLRFARALGFTPAHGPLRVILNWNGSAYLTFFDGLIRTQSRGTLSGHVNVVNGDFTSDGPLLQNTALTEQMHLGGKWHTVTPGSDGSPTSPPKIAGFTGWRYACHGNNLVMDLSYAGLRWVLSRDTPPR